MMIRRQGAAGPARGSKLGSQPRADNRDRPAVAVVAGVGDELIIEGRAPGKNRKAVIHFEDLLRARVRQTTIADQDAEAAGVEECLMLAGNPVDHAGEPERVIRPAPALAVERQPGRDGPVDIGELVGLDAAVRDAGAGKEAEALDDLLLEIDADPA